MRYDYKKMKQQLFALQREKEYFTGIASHDLQHPLSVISHLCELSLSKDKEPLSGEQHKIILLIQEAGREMTKLFQNYLEASRQECGKFSLDLAQTNITQLTIDIVARYREVSRKKNILLWVEAADNYYLQTDPCCYTRIIENLLSNAVKYTMPSKNVYVKIFEENESIHIEVKDEGVGIRKKELPLLFRKFQTLSSKPTDGELSTGLGLSITKFLLEQLKGSVSVCSEWGKGTCFRVSFCKK